MRKANQGISLALFLGLGLSGCSTEGKNEGKKDERSSPAISKDQPADKNKGRLGLQMPKQGKVPYKSLAITLESGNCWYHGEEQEEPQPQPFPVYPSPPSEPTPAPQPTEPTPQPTPVLKLSEKSDVEVVSKDDYRDYEDCSSTSYSQTFEATEEGVVTIDNINPGDYSIYVTLLDEQGNAIEEGNGWAYVAPGIVTQAYIELFPNSGNGRLDIEIVRGGERVSYDEENHGCGVGAWLDEDGNVHYPTCVLEGKTAEAQTKP